MKNDDQGSRRGFTCLSIVSVMTDMKNITHVFYDMRCIINSNLICSHSI